MKDKKLNLIKLDYSNLNEVIDKTVKEMKKNRDWAEKELP